MTRHVRVSRTEATIGRLERHFWLTRSVARAIGVSLTRALSDAQLTPEGYDDLVDRCRRCEKCKLCETWLAFQSAGAEEAPEHCAIAPQLNRLRIQSSDQRH